MTRREKLERKADRREDWAASRTAKSNAAFKRADLSEAATGIPFGQPILVGHHSEGAHRRTIAKAENAMRASIESADMANHHKSKAAGIRHQLDRSIFSDDDGAIQALEKRIAGREEERALNNAINKIIRRKPKNESTPEKIKELATLGMSEETAAELMVPDFCGRVGIPSYVNQNLGGNISSDKKRLERLKEQAIRTAAAEENADGYSITERNGWCIVTFAEKPEYEIIKRLKAAKFRWAAGSWMGSPEDLPANLA